MGAGAWGTALALAAHAAGRKTTLWVREDDILASLRAGGENRFLPGITLPKDMIDAAFKVSEELYAELSAKNANWKKVYTDYPAWRREANIWFRVTEARFDSFMQSAKL